MCVLDPLYYAAPLVQTYNCKCHNSQVTLLALSVFAEESIHERCKLHHAHVLSKILVLLHKVLVMFAICG